MSKLVIKAIEIEGLQEAKEVQGDRTTECTRDLKVTLKQIQPQFVR